MQKGQAFGGNIIRKTLASALVLLFAAGYSLMPTPAAAANNFCSSNTINAVFVTITEIDAHIAGQKGFSTLATGGPTQINLLAPNDGTSPGSCILGALGDIDGLPAGRYGQIRIILGNNGNGHGHPMVASSNACQNGGLDASVVNCVEYTPNGGSAQFAALDVGSASKTGLKVPPGQVGSGGLVVTQGDLLDLLVTMNPCSNIVATGFGNGKGKGNKKFKLKPTLHRGELSLVPFIAGTVVEGTSSNGAVSFNGMSPAVPGANVWLEDTDTTTAYTEGTPAATMTAIPVYKVLAETVASGPSATFEFCPVTTTDHLEIAAISATMPGGSNPSDVTLTTGVQALNSGVNGITIPLVEPTSAPTPTAQYTTQTGATAAIVETLDLGMAQSDGTANEAPFNFANAGLVSPTPTGTGGGGCTCPSNTDCACVKVAVPPDQPAIGPAKGAYTQAMGPGEFSLLANTSAASGAGSCSPNVMATATNITSTTVSKPTLSFGNCQ